MRLTTKGRFAVTALIDVALREQEGPVALSDVAQRQNISLAYLEQLFRKMRFADLVKSVRGPSGGYLLARQASRITVADIIAAVDEPIDTTSCGSKNECLTGKDAAGSQTEHCMTHELWVELNRTIFGFLNSVTLDDLMQRNLFRLGGGEHIIRLESHDTVARQPQRSLS